MKVLHLSTHDTFGGAAKAAYRLHRGLLGAGVDSGMQVAWRSSADETVRAMKDSRGLTRARRFIRRVRARWRLKLASRPAEAELFNPARTAFGAELLQELPPLDVIHLHWVAQLVDVPTVLPALAERGSIVWTLHDMNPLTGGCHYAGDCEGFLERCGRCPQLGSRRDNDLSRRVWRQKDRALSQIGDHRLHIVAPSEWMADLARRSSLMGRFDVTVIPNGVDTELFRPADPQAARQALGIPAEARVVLFTSHRLDNRRKGLSELIAALARIADIDNLTLLTLGEGRADLPPGVAWQHVGPFDDERDVAAVYTAADVLAVPSAEDNLPNTILEAQACGCPVVAFAAGGVGEAIEPGRTGLLAPAGDVPAFSDVLRELLLDDRRREEMSAACRKSAERRFSLQTVANRYTDLYQRLLDL